MTQRELFKEAVMQNLVDDARVKRVCKSRKHQGAARRALAVAICALLVAAMTILTIPSARAAVGGWLSQWFSTTDYLGQESQSRTKEPTIDALIHKAGNGKPVSVVITEVGADKRAQALADGFGVRLDEVAYTGDSVFITGWFTGTSGKFLLDHYTGGDTWAPNGEWTEGNMTLTMPGGEEWYGVLNPALTGEAKAYVGELGDGTLRPTHDDAGNLITTNPEADAFWYAYLKSNDVRFTFEATASKHDAPPLTGSVEAKLSFHEYQYVPAKDDADTLFCADLGMVTIDAEAYKSGVTTGAVDQAIRLSGTHRMHVREWAHNDADTVYVRHYNSDLDLSGVAIAVESITFTPTDTKLTMHMTLPEEWKRAERIAAAQGGSSEGIGFLFLLDGVETPGLFGGCSFKGNAEHENRGDPFTDAWRVYESSTIPPSEWREAGTLTIIPYTAYPTTVVKRNSKTGEVVEQVTLDPGVVLTSRVNDESLAISEEIVDRMEEFAVTLNLDDYR